MKSIKKYLFLTTVLIASIFGHDLAFAQNNCPTSLKISYPDGEKDCLNNLPISKKISKKWGKSIGDVAKYSDYYVVVSGDSCDVSEVFNDHTPNTMGGQFSLFIAKARFDSSIEDFIGNCPVKCKCTEIIRNGAVLMSKSLAMDLGSTAVAVLDPSKTQGKPASVLNNVPNETGSPTQLAIATQAPVPDPLKAERDRLAADLDASRKKQQELEEQLRVSQAAPAPNIRPTQSVPTERRVALVIGNADYKINPLKNPVNDSTDMARSLRAVGFDVIEANNTTLAAMREATRRFADKLVNSDVGLVYYSGHGVEVKGKNYLIPVNADIKREYEVVDQAFDASQFLEMMDSIRGPNNKRVNILLVDACRNNELQRSWRTTSNGLARMDAPGGTFISFATAPGRVAADGLGRNSPYTKHLLQALKQPNMPIEQVFKVVRRNVMDETKGEQVPWDNSSLVGDFFFTVQR